MDAILGAVDKFACFAFLIIVENTLIIFCVQSPVLSPLLFLRLLIGNN